MFFRFGAAVLVVIATVSARAATLTVTSVADTIAADGAVTLREAMASINAGSDANSDVAAARAGSYGAGDAIHFGIASGAQTIAPSYALPAIAVTVALDGSTQPGYAGLPLITIDGAGAGSQTNGLVIAASTDTTVTAIALENFGGTGILLIAEDVDATPPVANSQSVTTYVNTPVAIALTASDPDDVSFTFDVAISPVHGTISGFDAATGQLTYTPDAGFSGSDAFAFEASADGNTSDPVIVPITVIHGPGGLTAVAASGTNVDLTWIAVTGATSYQIDRRDAGGSFVQIGTSPGNAYSDDTVAAGHAFQYRVRAVTDGGISSNSAADLATTVVYLDDPLAAGTVLKAAHLADLRTAVDAVRALAGIAPAVYTDPATAGTTARATHLSELRDALDAALPSLGIAAGGYTDAATTGTTIRAVHFQELRERMR